MLALDQSTMLSTYQWPNGQKDDQGLIGPNGPTDWKHMVEN